MTLELAIESEAAYERLRAAAERTAAAVDRLADAFRALRDAPVPIEWRLLKSSERRRTAAAFDVAERHGAPGSDEWYEALERNTDTARQPLLEALRAAPPREHEAMKDPLGAVAAGLGPEAFARWLREVEFIEKANEMDCPLCGHTLGRHDGIGRCHDCKLEGLWFDDPAHIACQQREGERR